MGEQDLRGRNAAIAGVDEYSVRCGFRDFRFENGYFRLNGRRIFLKCSHTGNHCPIGQQLPHDPDLLRRDLHNVKVMGFNAIRFIAGVATRYQLDLCDEIGLLVYEEAYANWCLEDSPKMAERFDRSLGEMILRDRNHPSIVIWGLLNETPEGPVFRHAVDALKLVRTLDDSRMVMLNSGRWDKWADKPVVGIDIWRCTDRTDPCINHNGTDYTVRGLGITWEPGQLGLHPGREGEPAVLRWTAPEAGKVDLSATFKSIAIKATTDVHILHNGKSDIRRNDQRRRQWPPDVVFEEAVGRGRRPGGLRGRLRQRQLRSGLDRSGSRHQVRAGQSARSGRGIQY